MALLTGNNLPLRILQWNCRGFRRKRDPLQQLLSASSTPPDIVALQDAGTNVSLPGYALVPSDITPNPRVTTYVQNFVPYTCHVLNSPVAHTFL